MSEASNAVCGHERFENGRYCTNRLCGNQSSVLLLLEVKTKLQLLDELQKSLRAAHMPCVDCACMLTCDCAFDGYNTGTTAQINCLAAK